MENQVPDQVKTERSNILINLSRQKQEAYERRLLGTTQEVLIEECIEHAGGRYQIGHTKEYVKVGICTEESRINQLVKIKIEDPVQIIH